MVYSEKMQCEICKIFSNPVRLKILIALRRGPKSVTELTKLVDASQSVVSQHLAIMRSKGILGTEREGMFIKYNILYPEIMDAFDIMRKVTQKIRRQ
jgi:ArsR family transcriptional regulator